MNMNIIYMHPDTSISHMYNCTPCPATWSSEM